MGVRYQYGAKDPSKALDCSGLAVHLLGQMGIKAQGGTQQLMSNSTRVPDSQLQPGDLLFFNFKGGSVDHVVTYLGDGMIANASSTAGKVVKIPLRDYKPYKTAKYLGAWRHRR